MYSGSPASRRGKSSKTDGLRILRSRERRRGIPMRALRPPPGRDPRTAASPLLRAARTGQGDPSGGPHRAAGKGRPAPAEAAVSVPRDSLRDHRTTAEAGGQGTDGRFRRGATACQPPAWRPPAGAPQPGRAVFPPSPSTTLATGRDRATASNSAGGAVQGARGAHWK
jgi:hypothetical protein